MLVGVRGAQHRRLAQPLAKELQQFSETLNLPCFWTRTVQTNSSAEEQKELFHLNSSQWRPLIAPYQLTEEEAKSAFQAWHKKRYFSPNGLLQNTLGPTRAAFLPFWLFRAQFKVEFSGQAGFKNTNNDTEWEEQKWKEKGKSTYDWTHSCMQVYASYKYRQDYAAALKMSDALDLSRDISSSEASNWVSQSKSGQQVDIDYPDVKQSIAWNLACKAVRQKELKEAEEQLKADTGCDLTKDVQVRLQTLQRSARLIFIPAFALEYQYGEVFDPHGNRKPQMFQALISGLFGSQVAAERHFSPAKVQLGAALAMGSIASLAVSIGLYELETFSLASSFLSALLVCTSAGLGARLAPELIRQGAEDERIQVEEAEIEQIMSQGLGPQDIPDDKHEALRDMTEWRRWEEANKWAWDGDKRRRWAEALWRRQNVRKLQLAEYARNKARAEAKYQFEQQNEAKRRARYGASAQTHHFADGSGQRDFKGYYALLGLDGSLRGGISQPDIKAAFRKVAMRWHPDKLRVDSEQERQRAYTQFSKVQRAYDVLQDTSKRREYDNGIDPP